MLISAAILFCLVLKEVKLLILRPTTHTGVLLIHRVMSVSDGKARSRAILVSFGFDPAPPSFRHARPPQTVLTRETSFGLRYSSASGTVSWPVLPDFFRKSVTEGEERSPSQYVRTNVRRLVVS